MYRFIILALVILVSTLTMTTTAEAGSPTVKPIKMSKEDIAGSIFLREEAVHEHIGGTPTSDVVTFTSGDAGYQTGIFKSGPYRGETKAPGLPSNEFLYLLSGNVTITSSDGSAVTVHAGEAVTLPKGWTGVFYSEQGYTKLYAIYTPGDIK